MTSPSDQILLDYICSAGDSTYSHGTLDTKIYRAVESGASNAKGVCTSLGHRYGIPGTRGETPQWRLIERRMQWLRKKRFLSFNRHKGWKTLPVEKSEGAA